MTDRPKGTQLPRAAVGTFPYDHRTLAQVDKDRRRAVMIAALRAAIMEEHRKGRQD